MDTRQINISSVAIFKIVAILLGLWFLYMVRDVVVLLFLSVILTATFDSPLDWMAKRKIPRPLGVFIIYIALFLILGLLVSFLIPPLVSQFQSFANNLPVYSEKIATTLNGITQYAESYNIQFNTNEFLLNSTGNFLQSSNKIFSTTVEVFSFFISALVVLALTFYMSVKEDSLNKFLVSIMPKIHHEYSISVADRIKQKIGSWFAGQLLLMLIIFVLDFAALSIFRIPYALVLALLAGFLEIVPYLGPIISTVLASAIGFLISPVTGFMVLGILTIIQQIESNIIVPQLMKKAVGLDPIVVILALLIGAKLGGVPGAVLSVPIATSISVVAGDFFNHKEIEEGVIKESI
jgi:predicted PurR-regulated permease PerM